MADTISSLGREKSLETIQSMYSVPASEVRVYVHYLPSYFHFHVHFVHVSNTNGRIAGFQYAEDCIGCSVGKAILLDEILWNLSLDANYYQKATLGVLMGELQHAELYRQFSSLNL